MWWYQCRKMRRCFRRMMNTVSPEREGDRKSFTTSTEQHHYSNTSSWNVCECIFTSYLFIYHWLMYSKVISMKGPECFLLRQTLLCWCCCFFLYVPRLQQSLSSMSTELLLIETFDKLVEARLSLSLIKRIYTERCASPYAQVSIWRSIKAYFMVSYLQYDSIYTVIN